MSGIGKQTPEEPCRGRKKKKNQSQFLIFFLLGVYSKAVWLTLRRKPQLISVIVICADLQPSSQR